MTCPGPPAFQRRSRCTPNVDRAGPPRGEPVQTALRHPWNPSLLPVKRPTLQGLYWSSAGPATVDSSPDPGDRGSYRGLHTRSRVKENRHSARPDSYPLGHVLVIGDIADIRLPIPRFGSSCISSSRRDSAHIFIDFPGILIGKSTFGADRPP